ncbi:sensor histidine kinase [Hymenobacter daeguensis]
MLLPLTSAAQPAASAGWLPSEALSSLMVRTLVPTADGLLWVGTDDGVYRFDGTRLVSINALRRRGPVLPAVPCNYLLPLPDGQLWLGTDAGLYRFGPNGAMQALPLPAPGSRSRSIESLALGAHGQVLASQSHGGLQAYTPAGQKTGRFRPTDQLVESWAAPDSSLWLVNDSITCQLGPTGRLLGRWRLVPFATLRPVYDPRGRPWLLSAGAAYRTGPNGRLVKHVVWNKQSGNEPVQPVQPVQLLRSAAGPALLLPKQVLQLEWTPGPDPQLRPRFSLPLPPWPTAVWRGQLRADGVGHWWVFDTGTRGCWNRAAAPVFIHGLPGPGGNPYSVRASVRLPDGRLLVSSYEAGILTQAADSPLAPLRRWAAAILPTGNAPVLMGAVPGPLGPGGDWLVAGAYPLLRFNVQSGMFNRLPVLGQALNEPGVRSLVQDPATGRVWAGTQQGLLYYDAAEQAYRAYTVPGQPAGARPPFEGRIIEAVCPDGRGHLWLATPEGVLRLTLATGQREEFGPAAAAPRRVAVDGARCLYLAPDGNLWVGTRAHGLAVIDAAGRARVALSLGQGLPNASVATILPSAGGYLWLGTYQGLVRYQPATGRLAVFTTAQGLLSNECNALAAYTDPRDNSLLLGGVAGLHRIYPGQVPGASAVAPRLLLTSYTALGTSAETSRTRHLLPTDPLPGLHLDPTLPLVDLHLALTNSLDPSRARYAYRVRGWLADRWLGLGTTPQLRLQGLPPGHYTVEIRGESSQGVPTANTIRLPLTVTAEWWNRPLTWVLAALAASAAVYGWQRSRLRQLRRENALRARLAADLHDEVGSLLTRVTMQAELLRELQQGPPARLATLVDDSRAAASTVRDIIWSVDTGADTLGALVDRIRDHLDATARATGRDLPFSDKGLPLGQDQPLPPAVRQHTYLIFKEAVTNALKYSAPGTPIRVSLGFTPLLELTIDSRGGAGEVPGRAGQGLRNMRQRAGLLRAELAAGPVPGGWQVRLRQLP